jgi:short-subunit dehydrogenase
MFKKDLLKDKNILVTGGGTGLGKEMATHYAEHGANIFICGRRENVLKDTANEIMDNHGVSVHYETLDIRASQDVDNYIDRIFQKSPLDGLG